MRGLADEGFGGFHEGFAERWVRVDAVGEVAGDGGGFDGEDAFGDQLACTGSDDADAEDAFGFVFDNQFRQALGASQRLGSAAGGPGEADDFHVALLSLRFGFGEAAPREFRVGEDDGGDRDVVELGRFADEGFDGDLRLARGFVSQHRFSRDVADCQNIRIGGAAAAVDLDEAFLVDLDLRVFEAEVLAVRLAADGDEDSVEGLFRFDTLTLQFGDDAGFARGQADHFRVDVNRLELRFEPFL